jgi:hypothetical protein
VRRAQIEVEVPGGTESYSEVDESPLTAMESVEQIETYAGWPSPDDFD